MAGEHLVRVVLPHNSGIPADSVVNEFAFMSPGTVAAEVAAVIAVYNVAGPSGTIASKLAEVLDRGVNKARVDVFSVGSPAALAGGPLGSPFFSQQFTLGAGGGIQNYPSEVAIVASFHADYAGAAEKGGADANIRGNEAAIDQGAPGVHAGFDRPRSRRRGRVFFGPLNILCGTNSNVAETMIDGVVWSNIVSVMAALRDDVASTWAVWSRRDAIFRPVTTVSIENAFDTQRRRGVKSTARFSNP